uniref:G_PROTEIN_RECEP_F1_2 domain-containing protein n=1 Tax=Strongyloides papillosus TaxID=174720 RepID=A0A0N5B9Q2_STREA
MPLISTLYIDTYYYLKFQNGFQSNTFRLFLKYTEMVYLPCCPLSFIFFIEVYRIEFINFFCPNKTLFKKSTNSISTIRITTRSVL